MTMQSGYYRFPTLQQDTIVFTSEDDLWSVPAGGGIARRLTSSVSQVSRPILSPDNEWLAFVAREEGYNELYVMPSAGGEMKRLTFFGAGTQPVGWSRDGSQILFVTNHAQPFPRIMKVYSISPEGGAITEVPVGPAYSISLGRERGTVIGRNTHDPARWKRYRGGTAGDLWIDAEGNGNFSRLISMQANLACPMWVGDRIYFLSDHEGYGNIYSCAIDGTNLARHTDHDDYYARNASTDGRRIVYHCGGDIYLYDPASDSGGKVAIEYHSPRTQRNRKFVPGADYLQSYALHPKGHSVVMVQRGKPITMGNFAGPVLQYGDPLGVRYRLAQYLNDGKRIVATSDKGGEEALVILNEEMAESEDRIEGLDIGRPVDLAVSPKRDQVAFGNHRNEIIVVDLEKRTMKLIDRSSTMHDHALAWSPDGRWLAFNHADAPETSYLMVANVETGEKHQVTDAILHDVVPAFDPEGKYLYFLSYREFDPVYDNLHFHLSFPRGMRPYLITLRRDTPNPFQAKPKAPRKEDPYDRENFEERKEKKDVDVEIDFEGITRRILPFPAKDAKYAQVIGTRGKVYFLSQPVIGTLANNAGNEAPAMGKLESYDFESRKLETVAERVSDFDAARDMQTLIYRSSKRLRVFGTGQKPDEKNGDDPGIASGWLDLSRARVSITPTDEWHQMYREAWRLQRDFFWTEGMLGIDWEKVYTRYLPLIDRIGTRSEFSDVIWEMHGELGTSHAYEMGGDYRESPTYAQGFMGADLAYDSEHGGWIVRHIVRGDVWSSQYGSPLETPGVNIEEGDMIVAINGRHVSQARSPYEHLVNTAGSEITLTFVPRGTDTQRTVTIKLLGDETPVRYREWVENNRRIVHEATGGKVGYVHVPNMGPLGYSEFHRGFLGEVGRSSLIVDVRFNGGGHVSQLILEKLARKRIGYGLPRHGMPEPYPLYSVGGPIVAITNEHAGSDGDIFSHGFKLMNLGPLIGKRTWGGVVGIWPRNPLVDGSITTQPEFSTWFEDVRWGLENHGTDPDFDVDITPQEYVAGRDTQLERAVAEAMRLMSDKPFAMPAFDDRPVMAPDPLPEKVASNGYASHAAEIS
ncbi:MAG TPA: PDZ domain-containing protein [Candidatus Kapabacteria bacterium]|nr:PDZ domain-containing protein [Candidatus Kapabacteria bacterium]